MIEDWVIINCATALPTRGEFLFLCLPLTLIKK